MPCYNKDTIDWNFWMSKCISIAQQSIPRGEIPVSALFVHINSNTAVVGSSNRTNELCNPTAHCEILCLRWLLNNNKSKTMNQNTPPIKRTLCDISNRIDNKRETNSPNTNNIDIAGPKSKVYLSEDFQKKTPLIDHSSGVSQFNFIESSIEETSYQKIDEPGFSKIELQELTPSYPSDDYFETPEPLTCAYEDLNLPTNIYANDYFEISELACVVTLEPCIMCISALIQSGVNCIIYAAKNEKFGGCGGIKLPIKLYENLDIIRISDEDLQAKSIQLLQVVYGKGNPRAPPEKRLRSLKLSSSQK